MAWFRPIRYRAWEQEARARGWRDWPYWAVLVTLVDAVAFAVLIGRGHSRGRVVAAVFWLAAIVCLGPVGLYRIDAVSVPLAILGCLWLLRRPALAAALLAAATWIKVWPAALLAAAVVAVLRRARVIAAAALVSVAVPRGRSGATLGKISADDVALAWTPEKSPSMPKTQLATCTL